VGGVPTWGVGFDRKGCAHHFGEVAPTSTYILPRAPRFPPENPTILVSVVPRFPRIAGTRGGTPPERFQLATPSPPRLTAFPCRPRGSQRVPLPLGLPSVPLGQRGAPRARSCRPFGPPERIPSPSGPSTANGKRIGRGDAPRALPGSDLALPC